MKIRVYLCILFCVLILNLTGCSVYKAASNEGASVSDIQNCKERSCLLARGMNVVETKDSKNGHRIETYRVVARKTGLNYIRAAGHGAMDVMTFGLWEVVGTPVEGVISNNRGYIVAQATYPNKEAEEFTDITIFDAYGKKVK